MKSTKREILQTLKVLILALVLTVGVNYVAAYTWTAPTQTAPNGNTGAPLNVTSTGQIKDGGLTLCNGVCSPYGLLVLSGNVGIGTSVPTRALDVNGEIRLRGHLYDGSNTSGSAGQVLTRGTSTQGVIWAAPAGGSSGVACGGAGCNAGQIPKFAAGPTIVDSVITEDSAKIGIGLPSNDITTKLDINGNIRIRGDGSTSIPGVGKVLTSTANGTGQWQPGVFSYKGTVSSSNNVTNPIQTVAFDGRFSTAPTVTCTLSSRTFAGPTSVNICTVKSISTNSVDLYVDNMIGGNVPFDAVLNVMAAGN